MSKHRHSLHTLLDERLDQERGTLFKNAPLRVALTYPSPYNVGMSSLGYQVMYRILNERSEVQCERAFLPDDLETWHKSGLPLVTYEQRLDVGQCDVIAFSLAYELELTGIFECLTLSGVPILAKDRDASHPLIVIGGPLTFSNPAPASPFADVIVMGEAEEAIHTLFDTLASSPDRAHLLSTLASANGYFIPFHHGDTPTAVAKAPDNILPAYSTIITPNTELSNMHLVESERGCHRACTFCVMRRSTNGGMRLASHDSIMDTIPEYAPKVGLVGAAVSDHPDLIPIVRSIVDSGRQVSLSSLRADRMTPELLELLAKGGYRTLTVASDGASERLRIMMRKNIRAKHLKRTAELVRDYRLKMIKVYMIIGAPRENEEDIKELIEFTLELAKICRVALGLSPFVAKRNTPLDRQGFAGIKNIDRTLQKLRKSFRGKVELRSTSARWAWVEYCLSQGDSNAGMAALEAWKNGASFAAYKRAFKNHDAIPVPTAPLPPIPKTRRERILLSRAEKQALSSPPSL